MEYLTIRQPTPYIYLLQQFLDNSVKISQPVAISQLFDETTPFTQFTK